MRVIADEDMNKLLFGASEPDSVLSLPGLPGGGSKIYDRSSYGNNVTVMGATWKVLPSGLWHLYFDGTDDYLCPGDDSQYDITGQVTLGAWVCITDFADTRNIMSRDR